MPKYYVTTPIYYVNDKPHIGHAYTTVVADIVARWHRLSGDEVFFLTGTDEHGEKIEKAAEAAGMNPVLFVDSIVAQYKDLWELLGISNDDFIRTTDERHISIVRSFVRLLAGKGDIYKGEYEGWYCTPDETFFTELQLNGGRCPQCGRSVTRIKEETYFFRLSKYRDMLLDFYESNKGFLLPKSRAEEMINRVRTGLNDISITRKNVKWGIPFPEDETHTVYVWVDALLNYISALGWPNGLFGKFWPADVHIVGKEINWFHSVIWPAMLFSAGLETPRSVFAHGWWLVEGKKMSKSLGNAIDPHAIAAKYGVDALRYFMIKEMPLGGDGNFSEKALVARINGELVDDLGNLTYRVLSLAEKFNGTIEGSPELEVHLDLKGICEKVDSVDLSGALEMIWEFVRASNRYINEKNAWTLSGKDLANVLYNLLEALRIIAIMLEPFMPAASERIRQQLGTPRQGLESCSFEKFEGRVLKGGHLFEKIKPG